MRYQKYLYRVLLFAFIVSLSASLASAAPHAPLAIATNDRRVYLPLITGQASLSTFGVEMARLATERGLDLVKTSGTRWVRRNGLVWKQIEPVRGGGYHWDVPTIKVLEQELLQASQNQFNLILVVRGSPSWAVSPYTADCAPINPDAYGDFARFMAALVERYSQPPFNLKYYELGNEPDAPVRPDAYVFGCWGVSSDPYYGGRAYGAMFKQVAAAMKAVDPDIMVLNGGLMLDRAYQPGNAATTAGRFFEGVLEAGAGPSIDIVSFHSYIYWAVSGQNALGPSSDWRVDYLRKLLRRYGMPDKPMIRSETALLCYDVTSECRWAQADLVGRSFARGMRDGLLANIWYVYDNDSYHNTAMIEPRDVFVPRPAYFAYRTAARRLNRAAYSGVLPNLPAAVEGYLFQRDGLTVAVYWTDAGEPTPFTLVLPAGARAECFDRDGGPLACTVRGTALALVAQRSPQYVEVR